MKITLSNEGRYNFHNADDIDILVREENYIYSADGQTVEAVELTPSQKRRVENHFCGMSDCCCGSSPSGAETYQRGNLPVETMVIHL